MKNRINNPHLPALFLLLGTAGWLTRVGMYRFAMDEKGLLDGSHPLVWLLVLLTLGAAALLLLSRGEEKPLPGASVLPAAGAFVLAAGLVSAALGIELYSTREIICPALGILAAALQLWAGISHLRRKEPSFACNCLTGVFLGLYAILCYNGWSGNPQYHQYFYFAAGLILLALTACCQASFAAGLGWGKHHRYFALGAAFLCLTAIPASGEPLFLWAGGVWAALSLCRSAGGESHADS